MSFLEGEASTEPDYSPTNHRQLLESKVDRGVVLYFVDVPVVKLRSAML
jgi:hypothetical protein